MRGIFHNRHMRWLDLIVRQTFKIKQTNIILGAYVRFEQFCLVMSNYVEKLSVKVMEWYHSLLDECSSS